MPTSPSVLKPLGNLSGCLEPSHLDPQCCSHSVPKLYIGIGLPPYCPEHTHTLL